MKNQSKIENCKSKITIVGAGPAGASLAIRLAKKDLAVTLIEREKFPRHKLCGEFISPECLEHFRELGVFNEMLAGGGDRIAETVFFSEEGRSVGVPSKWFNGDTHGALGLSRAEMDLQLLKKAKESGVEVLEETQVVGVLFDTEKVCGVKVRDKNGETREIFGGLTIDATGRARVLGKLAEKETQRRRGADAEKRRRGDFKFQISDFRFQKIFSKLTFRNLKKPKTKGKKLNNQRTKDTPSHQKPKTIRNPHSAFRNFLNPKSKTQNRLVGFKAHLKNVNLEKGVCEIYFFRGGYGGLSFVEKGVANHCFLIKADIVKEFGGDANKIVENVIFKNKRAFETLKNAEPVFDWLAVSVDGFGKKDLNPAPCLFSVGDASAFIDPFTGSGMLMAFESAEILAEVIFENDFELEKIAAGYSLRHKQKFQKRLRICAIMRRAAFVPKFAKLIINVLSLSSKAREYLARSTRKTILKHENER